MYQTHFVINPVATPTDAEYVVRVDRNGRTEQPLYPFPTPVQISVEESFAKQGAVAAVLVGTYGTLPWSLYKRSSVSAVYGDAFTDAARTIQTPTGEELARLFRDAVVRLGSTFPSVQFTQLVKTEEGRIGFLHLCSNEERTVFLYEPIDGPALWSGGDACILKTELERQLTDAFHERMAVVKRLFDRSQTTGFSINEL